MVNAPILSVSALAKRYASKTAVEDVSFAVHPGETMALLGPNGAGKTTIINMLLGILAPSAGSIAIGGIDLAKKRGTALMQTNFAAVYAALPGNLTVRQNLRIFGMLYSVPELRARIADMLRQFNLEHLADTRCGLLSSGEQTRVSLAKALLNQPKLLLLDEPTASLDPATAHDIRAIIRDYARAGGAVLWTSHNMAEVEEACDRVLFLSRGRILLEGDPKTLPSLRGEATLEDLFITLARERA